MSIKNNTRLMTSEQVKRQLKSIDTVKSDIKHSLLDFVEQIQCLDHVVQSIGLMKEGFSFINKISWDTIFSKLEKTDKNSPNLGYVELKDISETILRSSNQLENELVPQLQKLRNNWMLDVLLIEFVFLSLLTLAVAGITHIQGLWDLSHISFSIQPFLYERPIFSLLAAVFLFAGFVWIHFSIRHFVAGQLVKKLSKEISEFDLTGAFLKNTRMRHSIFRPDIIGWNWLSRKCLAKSNLIQS